VIKQFGRKGEGGGGRATKKSRATTTTDGGRKAVWSGIHQASHRKRVGGRTKKRGTRLLRIGDAAYYLQLSHVYHR